MTIAARYQPGAVRTPFVDRDDILQVFADELDHLGERPRLLELSGVGGIGKSRLLHELRRRIAEGVPTALLNLQEPAQRSSLAALGTLRAQFGEARVHFDRFDIAYAVWWQRLNPLVPLTIQRLPWLSGSEVLAEVLSEAIVGLPIFNQAVKVLDILARRFKRWQTIRHDPTLLELDELSLDQVGDAVTYLFAQDLDDHGRFVVFVDAYEALVGGVARHGSAAQVDAWLRDLLGQLDRGLAVVASREPLGWARREAGWAERIRSMTVTALPYPSRLELLEALGVDDPAMGEAIARDCAGVPYFLHLARESGSTSSTYARIEERFLLHVAPEMVRILELLSVARVFDVDTFREVTSHYGLRTDLHAWETLISYSFIASAGPDTLQMHQLMARAIQARLSPPVVGELHALLRDIAQDRARRTPSVATWREAAFHAASAHPTRVTDLLSYADHLAAEGKPGLDAMRNDLLGIDATGRYDRLTHLLAAEASLLVGDAGRAADELRDLPRWLAPGADEIDARSALAAANAQRILGNTAEALSRYATVWPSYPGPARLDAGMWHADLEMAQGRFVDAIATADAVEQACPPDRPAVRADLARLRCLAYRFAFDPQGAAKHAAAARAAYAEVGHHVGLANISTNDAEILAMTEPSAAIAAAKQAIDAQRQLGADHEVGKALTALSLANLGLGELEAAGHALDEAATILDACGYRSGRARAELVRALCHARAGHHDEAVSCAIHAVAEFEAVEVYPTMVLLARALLDRIGRPDPSVSAAAARAEAVVQPLTDLVEMESAIGRYVGRLVNDGWDEVYAAAAQNGATTAGFYHNNVRVGANLVRTPVPGADRMDLHIWPEPQVLSVINRHVSCVSRLLSTNRRPPYQIHRWVDGTVLNDVAPKGARVPDQAVGQFAAFIAKLGEIPLSELPPTPEDWPADGDSAGFAALLVGVTESVHAAFRPQYQKLWTALGIPDEPFAPLELSNLGPRPFRLIHADLHRKNVLIRQDGTFVFLDWELALAGDPVYEIAVHLHKMAYQPDEDAAMRQAWAMAANASQWPDWAIDLERYLAHERIKSAIVDSVRYAKVIAADPGQVEGRAVNLARKLTLARQIWGDSQPVDLDEVAALLARHRA